MYNFLGSQGKEVIFHEAQIIYSGSMLIFVSLIGSSFSCSSSAETYTWRMATSWTADSIFYTGAASAICDRVEELSGGRLVIEACPAGEITDAMGVLDAVGSGEAEIGHSWCGYWMDKEASFELFSSIPDQMTAQEWMVWLYGPSDGMALWQELYAKYNLVPLPGGLNGAEFGFFTTTPVTTLEDFDGLTLRVTGLAANVVEELGATAVSLSPSDIVAALQNGEIDGFEFGTPAVDWPMGFQDFVSYVSLPCWHQPSAMFETIVNQDAWNSLPQDLQAILEAACKEISMVDYLAYTEGSNAEALEKFIAAGMQINVLDEAAVSAIAEITNRLADAKAADDAFYARVLESQRSFREEYRTWEQWESYSLYT
jgi:TRAP-type mannitol/chloroaromatic compound transport system substrate-binding protein